MNNYEAGIEAAAKAVENLWYRAGKPARREQAAEIVEAFLGEVDAYTIDKKQESVYVGFVDTDEAIDVGVLVPLRPKSLGEQIIQDSYDAMGDDFKRRNPRSKDGA